MVVNGTPFAFAHPGADSPSRTISAATYLRLSPMAAACPISGCCFRSASRFAGEMFFPPAVMISSFLRSTIFR